MNNYKELIVWQKSMVLVEVVYEITVSFPKEEKFGLTNQIRKSVVSIPSNIAEGASRISKKEFRNFLGIANGSLNEILIQLKLSTRLRYMNKEKLKEAMRLVGEVQKILYTLINKFSQI